MDIIIIRLLLLCLFFQIFIPTAISQNSEEVKIEWSDQKKMKYYSTMMYFMAELDGNFYVATDNGFYSRVLSPAKFEMFKFNNNLEIELDKKIKLKDGPGKRLYEGSYVKNDNLHFISLDERDRFQNLYIETINKNTLESKGDVEKILEADTRTGFF